MTRQFELYVERGTDPIAEAEITRLEEQEQTAREDRADEFRKDRS